MPREDAKVHRLGLHVIPGGSDPFATALRTPAVRS
jgi:hypothetical protein